MSVVARHRIALDHERACHRAVLASLETVPADRRDGDDYEKCLALGAHLVASRELWLARIRGATDQKEAWFPQGWTLEELAARDAEVHDAWKAFLGELTDERLTASFLYRSWEGDEFENAVEDVLFQLHGHSFYHRGQIAQLVRRLGGEPAETEYVLSTRRRVEARG